MFENFLNIILIFVTMNSFAAIIFNFIQVNTNPLYPGHLLGFFNHPNTLSIIYTISIPIVFYKYFAAKIKPVLFIILLALFSYCLLFTFSRAGYLGALLGILLITFFKSKKTFVITIIITSLIMTYFVFGLASSKINSSVARILLMTTAISMISQNTGSFLWGTGVYNSIEVFKDEKIFFGNYENVVDPHNIILLLGIQFGMIVSILSIFYVLLISFKTTLKSKLLIQSDKLKVNLLVTIIIATLFHNMLEDILVYPEFFVMPLFLTFFGVLLMYNNYLKKRTVHDPVV